MQERQPASCSLSCWKLHLEWSFMMPLKWLALLGLLLALCGSGHAQENPEVSPASQTPPLQRIPLSLSDKTEEPIQISVTQHSILSDTVLPYTARAGCLPLEDESGRQTAEVFFAAYERDDAGEADERPVGFVFNGGPGASSLWLHFGAIGPKRVPLKRQKPELPGTERRLADNELSWLAFMDLVFVDPVGTGFSRTASGQDARQFYSTRSDIRAMSDFIRRFVTRFNRWPSPKFIVGESYGAIRAAGLVPDLFEHYGMEVDGLVMISPALSLPTFTFGAGNDLPYALFLPSYTAVAWHHKKLSQDLQRNLADALSKSEQWVQQEFWSALLKGNSLAESERARVTDGLVRYTGLPRALVERSRLRIERQDFLGELLRDQKLHLSLFDGRVTTNREPSGIYEDPGFEPTIGPLVSSFLHHLKDELHYDRDRPYQFFSDGVNAQWNWEASLEGSNTGLEMLQKGMNRNRKLKVFVAAGIYDLDTPYAATQYSLNHLAIDPPLQKNITLKVYEGGHLPYTDATVLKLMTGDVSEFVKSALER
jgi:carboxypeptidase C (cathepsin A)